jgi:ATP-dependent Clp protease ATP-binding subunit ClpC
MNGYDFTERVRDALIKAREEAAALHHDWVGPEHLLLGVARIDQGVAAAVLTNLGVDSQTLHTEVRSSVKPGNSRSVGPDLPYTARGKKVLEHAMLEARDLGHSFVGTEHLLLGLLREPQGVVAAVFGRLHLTLEAARAETLRLLQSAPGVPESPSSRRRPLHVNTARRALVIAWVALGISLLALVLALLR